MYVCSNRDMCMLVQVSTEAREGHQTLWFWSYRWLEATVMDAGNRTGILWESNMCSWLLTISPAPIKHLKYFLPECVCVACVYGCMCVYMCAEVRSQHQVFCPISLLLSVQWSFQSLHGLNQPADEEMGHFCIPFYLLCTSHPRGISIVCLAGTMPSSALPVCLSCVDGTGTFTFLGPAFLVQSCACNVHPSCYVQLFLQYCRVGTYSIIWTHYTILSHVTPAKCLSGFQFKAILMSVVVWTQGTFVVGVGILSHKVCICSNRHCSSVSLSIWRNLNDQLSMYERHKIQLLPSLKGEACTKHCCWKLHLPKCSWVVPWPKKSSSNVTVFGNKNS